MKANDYQDLLDTHLLPLGEAIGGQFWIFHQDNATIHVANSTWEWFLQNGVQVMDWPANSPDLNPMENLWAILCCSVYADGKQYTYHRTESHHYIFLGKHRGIHAAETCRQHV